jgi:phage terminase small subunit
VPRRSASALTTLTSLPPTPRLVPPEGMAEDARQVFLDIVLANDPTHFKPSDMPLLLRYCEAHAMAARAAAALSAGPMVDGDGASPWVSVYVAMTKTANALAMRLRLSPQARQPNNPKRTPVVSYYERMRLEDR